jgi:hypothetical protein
MAAAADVSFDILLGGKIKPEVLEMFKDLEDLLKKQGATARTISAVMGRAYKETFDSTSKEAKKSFASVEHSSKEAFKHMAEQAKEAQKKMHESMEKMKESYEKFAELVKKPLEWFGVTGLLGGIGAAFTGEELIKKGVEVHRARETEAATLRGTLAGRGRAAETPEWMEAAERIAARARVGHGEAMDIMRRLAVSGRFEPAGAEQMAMALIGLGGGTEAGAQATMQAYGKLGPMLAAGRVRPAAIARLGGGGGLGTALLQQIAADTGIPIAQLGAAFGPEKVSRRTGEVTGGALAGAKGIDALNKAILELGQNRGFELIKAHMSGMEGMFYRFGEHWEDFVDKIGEFFEKVIIPIAEEINDWIDKINFTDVFRDMIDTGKQWGQMIKNVWDALANTPVVNHIKEMFSGMWRALTGGVELFEKTPRPMWNKEHTRVIMARFMTEAGRAWTDKMKEVTEGLLSSITGLIDKLIEIDQRTKGLQTALGALLKVLTEIDNLVYGKLVPTLYDLTIKGLTKVWNFARELGNIFHGMIDKIVSYIPDWLKPERTEKPAAEAADAAQQRADIMEEYLSRRSLIEEKYAALPQQEPYISQHTADLKELHDAFMGGIQQTEEFIKMQKALEKANDALKQSTDLLEKQFKKTTGNDLKHFDAAIEATTASLMQLSALNFAGGGFGLGSGYTGGVSGAHFTEYGPAVPGDQPGGTTYDWNSYHRIGAWPSITGPLRAGDVALGYGAQAKYGVMPGQMFSDEYGRTWRFADRSGSKDPYNVDVFRGALGGIVRRPTRALIGESGPEAVLPLSGAGAAGLGATTINITVQGNADPEAVAEAVERVLHTRRSRAAVV